MLTAGHRLGPYEIVSALGAGGMGEVYRARDPRLGREVAIKVLPAAVASDRDRLSRFEQEARAASAIHHPNLLTVFDVGTEGGVAYLVTELLSGESLRDVIRRGPLPLDHAVEIVLQVAKGLAAAHAKGIVHRDLKPENLFVTEHGVAKILDFGLARFEEHSLPEAVAGDAPTLLETTPGTVLGTIGYMAPEQVRGERGNAQSDLFSLGVVFYELLAGERPFRGSSAPDVLSAVLRDEPPPLPAAVSGDRALASVVERCLEKDTDRRTASSAELVRQLEGLASARARAASAETLVTPVPSRGEWARATRAPHRRWAPVGALAAVLLLAVFAAAYRYRASWFGVDSGAGPAPTIRSLAVLPFANLSGHDSEEYFADGFTDQLTTTLANLSALKVIARTSAAGYKGTEKRASQIGRELGVDGLLSGSVVRAKDRVRITAQLVSAADEINLWAESFERGESDVLTLQAEVARAIASAIEVRLSEEESARLAAAEPVDPRAMDAYLRGRALWSQRAESEVREGLRYFETSARIAPQFALAVTGLADSHIILGVYGFDAPNLAFPEARAAAERAIELDPRAGEPHASLGDIHYHYDWDWAASERELRQAIELSPGFATAYLWLSEPLLRTGRTQEAIEVLRKARTLDPLSMTVRTLLARAEAQSGESGTALSDLREAVRLDAHFPGTRDELARLLRGMGRSDEALVEARRLIELHPDHVPALGTLGLCLGAAGNAEEARAILADLDARSGQRFVSALHRARIAMGLGERERALSLLEEAVDAREGTLPDLERYGEFERLSAEPRFQAIRQRVGLP